MKHRGFKAVQASIAKRKCEQSQCWSYSRPALRVKRLLLRKGESAVEEGQRLMCNDRQALQGNPYAFMAFLEGTAYTPAYSAYLAALRQKLN